MPSRLSVPYNPELALTSSFLHDDDEESPEPRTPTKRRRGGDVRVELNKPPNKSAKLPNKAKMGLFFRRSCGGKRLHLPPSWPLKDISGTRSDPGHALSARTNPGNSTKTSKAPLPSCVHVQPTLEAKGQSYLTINSLPNISSSEAASMVVLAKMDASHTDSTEIQPRQSAETGLRR